MRYANADHMMIDAGADWREHGFSGQFIPRDPGNRDYLEIIERGLAVADFVPPPPPPVVVSQWQAREALRRVGKLGQVNAFVAALGEEHEAFVAWNFREIISSDSPLIAALKGPLGLSDVELDAIFALAKSL